MNASELKDGQRGLITSIENSALRVKLTEMGCFEENSILSVRTAPLGDPIAFKINEYVLGLRKEEARLIQVKIIE